MELLSKSYSEIVISPEPNTITDANTPQPLTFVDDGLILKEGDMVHFIAKNLESKIKSSGSDVFCNSGMYICKSSAPMINKNPFGFVSKPFFFSNNVIYTF